MHFSSQLSIFFLPQLLLCQSSLAIAMENLQAWNLFFFSMAVLSFHQTVPVEAYFVNVSWCFPEAGNYTQDSIYQRDLLYALSTSPSRINDSGYYTASIGMAFVTMLCRADMQLDDCHGCVQNASQSILTSCPSSIQAVFYYRDCSVSYSNKILGIGDVGSTWVFWNPNQMDNIELFYNNLGQLVHNLIQEAAAGATTLLKVAVGDTLGPGPRFQTIYSIVQCMPYLSSDDCTRCLTDLSGSLARYNNGSAKAILQPVCRIQYDTDQLFNASRIREVRLLSQPPLLPPGSQPLSFSPPSSPQPSPSPPTSRGTVTMIVIIVVVVVGAVLAFTVVAIIIFKRNREKKGTIISGARDVDDDTRIEESKLQYDFNKVKAATGEFSEENKLGRGGFGIVYKGTLEDGREVAVKRLMRGAQQGDLEFKNEVILLAKLQHRNFVRLVGFAMRGIERLLIYEYIKNGSLDHFIFDETRRIKITWEKRFKIIMGIARGLLYLHEDSNFCIVHRDIKASNILLDNEMNPKIADFGTARLFEFDKSQENTSKIVGTFGYMPPEYLFYGQVSVKIDVFSFGVLVLEIISGKKNNSFIVNGETVGDMLSFAWRSWQEGTTKGMIDHMLLRGSGSLHDILKCIHIGLLCVQESASSRPTMASVVLMLNSSSITMPIPSRPAFFIPNTAENEVMSDSTMNETSISS